MFQSPLRTRINRRLYPCVSILFHTNKVTRNWQKRSITHSKQTFKIASVISMCPYTCTQGSVYLYLYIHPLVHQHPPSPRHAPITAISCEQKRHGNEDQLKSRSPSTVLKQHQCQHHLSAIRHACVLCSGSTHRKESSLVIKRNYVH